MSIKEITCALVDEDDLDTRYLAGRLSEEEAEGFEAHFFACERCWELVHQGAAVRSAFGAEAAALQLPRAASVPKRPQGRWWGLAAAAGIAAAAVGLWRLSHGPETGPAEDVFRGTTAPFTVAATASRTGLSAAWPRLPEADVYQIRLYSADGRMVLERETADTTVSVPVDSIPGPIRGAELFWQVQALDQLRNSVARADLTPAVIPNH